MNLEAINSLRLTRAAKPWANQEAKRKQEASINNDVAEFLARGGEIKTLKSFGADVKQVNNFNVNVHWRKNKKGSGGVKRKG